MRTLNRDQIAVGSFSDAARGAAGTVVVIDVFRAFTTAAVALANGAERIVMLDDLAEALHLRDSGHATACIGERGGRPQPGFEYGNSPAEIAGTRFDGAVLAQTTTNGTRGILAAGRAERIYAGALVTAAATARAILSGPDQPVTLIAMGVRDRLRADEDELCALYLRSLLLGRSADTEALQRLVRTMCSPVNAEVMRPGDLDLCLAIDSQPFAIRVTEESGRQVARAERTDE